MKISVSRHLKATITGATAFGLLMGLWDLLIDKSLKYALVHSLVMTVGFGVILYFIELRKSRNIQR